MGPPTRPIPTKEAERLYSLLRPRSTDTRSQRPQQCRFSGCSQTLFFDQRFNEHWEWCSPQHMQMALEQGIEKVCEDCGVWPSVSVYKYCGRTSCNKKGFPLAAENYCRLQNRGCNQPAFFDRRFNAHWEWCSPQHIQTALEQGIEKVCKDCGIWPRKYASEYCGEVSCNKKGFPIP